MTPSLPTDGPSQSLAACTPGHSPPGASLAMALPALSFQQCLPEMACTPSGQPRPDILTCPGLVFQQAGFPGAGLHYSKPIFLQGSSFAGKRWVSNCIAVCAHLVAGFVLCPARWPPCSTSCIGTGLESGKEDSLSVKPGSGGSAVGLAVAVPFTWNGAVPRTIETRGPWEGGRGFP